MNPSDFKPAMETLMSSSELLPQHGPGFILRRLLSADLGDFQDYRHDEELGRYQGWRPTPDAQASAFLAEMSVAPFPHPGHWVQIGIAEPESQRLIGDIGVFLDLDATSAEIGFDARSYRPRGAAWLPQRFVCWSNSSSNAVPLSASLASRMRAICRRCDSMERVGMQRTETRQTVFRGEACVEHTYIVTRAGT